MDKDEAMRQALAVERGELPSGSVVVKLTGPNSLTNPGTEPIDTEWHAHQHVYLSTQYGRVRVALVSATWAHVTVDSEAGQAHINDDRPALTYRGQDYIGGVGFDIADGVPTVHPDRVHLSKRPQWVDAPKTHAAAMVDAIRVALVEYLAAHPTVLGRAELRETARQLNSLVKDRDELMAQLIVVNDKITEVAGEQHALRGTMCSRCAHPITGHGGDAGTCAVAGCTTCG